MSEACMGTPSGGRSNQRHPQLGNGIQEMGSRVQNPNLLW
jgi:hypothetical protein